MEPEETVVPEDIETPAEVETVETPEVVEPEVDWKAKAEELEDKNKKLYARLKKDEKPVVHSNQSELTPKDVYALMNAKVAEEDIEQVHEYAQFKKISVAEALKSTVVKSMLDESSEQRRTANATQTRGGARGTSQVSGADVLAQAEKTGQLPDSEEDIQKLWMARQARRKSS